MEWKYMYSLGSTAGPPCDTIPDFVDYFNKAIIIYEQHLNLINSCYFYESFGFYLLCGILGMDGLKLKNIKN